MYNLLSQYEHLCTFYSSSFLVVMQLRNDYCLNAGRFFLPKGLCNPVENYGQDHDCNPAFKA